MDDVRAIAKSKVTITLIFVPLSLGFSDWYRADIALRSFVYDKCLLSIDNVRKFATILDIQRIPDFFAI